MNVYRCESVVGGFDPAELTVSSGYIQSLRLVRTEPSHLGICVTRLRVRCGHIRFRLRWRWIPRLLRSLAGSVVRHWHRHGVSCAYSFDRVRRSTSTPRYWPEAACPIRGSPAGRQPDRPLGQMLGKLHIFSPVLPVPNTDLGGPPRTGNGLRMSADGRRPKLRTVIEGQ